MLTLVAICALPLGADPAPILESDDGWEAAVARLCEEAVASGVPGLSVAVSLHGELVLARGFGHTDSGRNADEETTYPVGFLAEPLVATALLALVDEERLALEDPIVEYLPAMTFDGAEVRVEHLLAHTSGIPDFSAFADARGSAADLEAVLEFLRDAPLDTEPGSCFAFSNSNTLLATLLLEKVAGEPARRYLRREVLDVLAMDGTGPSEEVLGAEELSHEVAGRLVTRRGLPGRFSWERLGSNVADLLRFQRGCAEELLSPAAHERLCGDTRLDDGIHTGRGFGVDRTELHEIAGCSFGGAHGDARVRVAWYPEAGLAIAIAASSGDAPVEHLESGVARAVLGLEEPGVHDHGLDEAVRARYLGGYYVGCSRYLVRETGERLEVVPPDGPPFRLRYQGRHRFVDLDDAGVRLEFTVSEDGTSLGFVLDVRGVRVEATRLE